MKISIIYDNQNNIPDLIGGWGFSCLINDSILFDTGENGIALLNNLIKMGKDIRQINKIVISHNHKDHFGGLIEFLKIRKGIDVYICSGFSDEFKSNIVAHGANLIESNSKLKIDDNIFITSEFHSIYKGKPMFEQSLVLDLPKGVSIIPACAHAGIETIAKSVLSNFYNSYPYFILGGFHLSKLAGNEIIKILSNLEAIGFDIYPLHCSGSLGKMFMKKEFYLGKELLF